jgi:hypothetical protein
MRHLELEHNGGQRISPAEPGIRVSQYPVHPTQIVTLPPSGTESRP